ncbi:MAG: hypothetical protein VW397_08810 [Candidatus Margulisiibacteriota bacterium]
MLNFYLFTNSPGEVYSWVKPVSLALGSTFEESRIYVFLTPCQYATGNERNVCLNFDYITKVFSPIETIKYQFFSDFESGFVFYLGGDPAYAKRFAKRTQSDFLAYSENKLNTKGIHFYQQKSRVLDLMKSGLSPFPIEQKKGVVLLPGSRPDHLKVALPIMLDIVNDEAVTVMLSPFSNPSELMTIQTKFPNIKLQVLNDVSDLGKFKYALTIPGTNTMQLAYLSVPFMMIFPTHDSSVLRLDGLFGLFLHLPIIGLILKRIILNIAIKQKRFYALPNLYFNEYVCPELVGAFNINQARLQWGNFINDDQKYLDCLSKFSELQNIHDPVPDFVNYIKKKIN